jgi:hypothetical protein
MKIMKTQTKLERLKAEAQSNIDITKLKDIKNVEINPNLPIEERMRDFIKQIGNPYIYKSDNIVVRVSFAGTSTIEECLGHALSNPFRH